MQQIHTLTLQIMSPFLYLKHLIHIQARNTFAHLTRMQKKSPILNIESAMIIKSAPGNRIGS